MNDLDLHAALHRDADLVGAPSPDLLDQLVRRRQHQRRQRAGMLTAGLALAVVAAAVPISASFMTRSEGSPAQQTTTAPTTQPSPETIPATPTEPSTYAEPSPATTVPPPSAVPTPTAAPEADPAAPVLGPDGVGALKLGMSRDEAEATGLVEPFWNQEISLQCHWRSALVGAPAGEGSVMHSETMGVALIWAYEGIHTPEGIALGSSLAEVKRAYPNFIYDERFSSGSALAPGNDQAFYRIFFTDEKVDQLILESVHQNCVE